MNLKTHITIFRIFFLMAVALGGFAPLAHAQSTSKVYIKVTSYNNATQVGTPAIYYPDATQQTGGSYSFALAAPPATDESTYATYLDDYIPLMSDGSNDEHLSPKPPRITRIVYELHVIGTAWDTTDYLLDTKTIGELPSLAMQIFTSNPSASYTGDPFIKSSYLAALAASPSTVQTADPNMYAAITSANIDLTKGTPAALDDTAASTSSTFNLLTGLDTVTKATRDVSYIRRTRADFPYWVKVIYVSGDLKGGDQIWVTRTGQNYEPINFGKTGSAYNMNVSGNSSSIRIDNISSLDATTGLASWPANTTKGLQVLPALTGFADNKMQMGIETWSVQLVKTDGSVVELASPAVQIWPATCVITYPPLTSGAVYTHVPAFTISVSSMYPSSKTIFSLIKKGSPDTLLSYLDGSAMRYGSFNSEVDSNYSMTIGSMPENPQSDSSFVQNLEALIPAVADNGTFSIHADYVTPHQLPAGQNNTFTIDYQFDHKHIIRVAGQLISK